MAERPKRYKVIAKVISQKGTCHMGHKVDDEWVIGMDTPAGICLPAFNAIYPDIQILKFGGTFSGDNPYAHSAACPDAENPVVFELTRLRK